MRIAILTLVALFGAARVEADAGARAEAWAGLARSWDESLAEQGRARALAATEDQVRAWEESNVRSTHEFGIRCIGFARSCPETSEAVEALTKVVKSGYGPETGEALAILRRDYSASPLLVPACENVKRAALGAFEEAEAFVREVARRNPHREVQGHAYFSLAWFLQWYANVLEDWNQRPQDEAFFAERLGAERQRSFRARDPIRLRAESEALFEKVRAEFAGIRDRSGRALETKAEGKLAELRTLTPGQTAPEIVGHDQDDQIVRLSDFRGQVVVLSFFGNWCGPCRAAYPHERRLRERLRGRPFALLGVDTDEDRAVLARSIREGEVTWPCWFEGGIDGKIARAWGVDLFPTVYILDARGVIRAKNLPERELDEMVDRLLTEIPAPR